jgi:hypothetical protein
MGSHRGPDCHEKWHKRQAIRFVAFVQIAVQHKIGKVPLIAMPKVHQKEGKVIKDVDRGQRLIKLEAIKESGLSIEQADVPQDQIAVTPAHLTGRLPPIEKLRMNCEGLSKRVNQVLRCFLINERCGSERLIVDIENG